ncbi:hypothetical protein GQ55_3G410500 [Panicum hallii var. hallii]|uniref:Uncharacterized protein n=1 Tax=Panicum hallii var. hallii TaxID=1504633 RepID=A0A2T7EH57_9POAL|nr:hypothetical protein GQ55_3G410500 [Panicum hallii var. hallii]
MHEVSGIEVELHVLQRHVKLTGGAECLAGLLGARVLSFRVRKSLRFGYIGVKKPEVPASDWSFNLEMSADWLG